MTYAPQPLKDLRAFLKGQDSDLSDAEVGIVGGPSHVKVGTSYHLGLDQLQMGKNPYSARTARDKAGLADPTICNAASAIDIDDDLDELRPLSQWLVAQCRSGAPDTFDIREIIFSPDGVQVLRWDRERGPNSAPVPDSDLSHRSHTHVSYYRDSVLRDKTGPFRRFYLEDNDMTPLEHTALLNTEHYLQAIIGMHPQADNISNTVNVFSVVNELAKTLRDIQDQIGDGTVGGISEDRLRQIMREEIAKTTLA